MAFENKGDSLSQRLMKHASLRIVGRFFYTFAVGNTRDGFAVWS